MGRDPGGGTREGTREGPLVPGGPQGTHTGSPQPACDLAERRLASALAVLMEAGSKWRGISNHNVSV